METRRGILVRVAIWLGLLTSYGTAAAFAARFLYPRRQLPRRRSIYVGPLDSIIEGEATEVEDPRGASVQVVREANQVRALSTVCPHLGCRVRWEPERQRFICPCHQGVFDREGRVLSGPPPRPLDRYQVDIADGQVYLVVEEDEA